MLLFINNLIKTKWENYKLGKNMSDYLEKDYLSTTEVAAYLGIKVKDVVVLIRIGKLPVNKSAGGQYRVAIEKVKQIEQNLFCVQSKKRLLWKFYEFHSNDER